MSARHAPPIERTTFARAACALVVLALALTCLGGCRSTGTWSRKQPDYELELRGARRLSASDIRDAVREDLKRFTKPGLERVALEDAAWSLERLYRRSGFPDARVEAELGETPEKKPIARFDVEEGPRVRIRSITLVGNRALKQKELEPFFADKSEGLFERGPHWYVESELKDAARSVQELYVSLGWLDAVVSEPEVAFSRRGHRVRVTVRIVEGRRYVMGSATLEGDLAGLDDALTKLANASKDKPYSPSMPRSIRGRCEDLLGRKGHADARVRLVREERGADGRVALAFAVDPGPIVHLTDLVYEGNVHTKEELIRSALRIDPGERYDVEALRDATERLQSTGLFTTVRLEPRGEGEERSLLVHVEERARREVYVEPGYGSYERLRLKAGWRERNVFGSGRELDLDGTFGGFAQEIRAGLGDPRFLGHDTRADAVLFATRREEPSFTKSELGASLTFTNRFSRELQGSLGYSLRHSKLSDADVTDPEVQEALESVDISSVKASLAYDNRDDPFAPGHGSLDRVSVEYGSPVLGSELDFLRVNWTLTQFVPLWRGAVLGGSWRAGFIAPLHETDTIPLQERFFNGGENSVRSFKEDELGPRDVNGEPIGGEAFDVFSAELRQRLYGRLEGVLFFDVGNVVPSYQDFFAFDGMERAVGTGLRYMLPVGPVRLDVGFNPWHDSEEDAYVVHLSVGMAF